MARKKQQTKAKKEEKSGVYTTDYQAKWIAGLEKDSFQKPELNKFITFFLFHSPCSQLSAMSKTLLEYGWDDPWKKPQSLRKRLVSLSTNPNLVFSAQSVNDMQQALKKSNLSDDFPGNHNTEQIALYNNMYNQFMSVFYHLRNAIAHGRFTLIDIGADNGDYIIAFEDINKNKDEFRVTARMTLLKSTLDKWIDTIEAGFQVEMG